ncbi:MAG: hypothetical protein ACYS9C_14000 [Planctomycetota bacterium]|jgi:hypothetical protein
MSEAGERSDKRPGEDEGVPTAGFRHSTPWRACLGEAARNDRGQKTQAQ